MAIDGLLRAHLGPSMRFMLIHSFAAIAALLFAAPAAPPCTSSAVVAAPDFRFVVCLDNGPVELDIAIRENLDAIEASDPADIAWCVDTDIGSFCGENLEAHPWCDPDPNTGDSCLQDVTCCILTIINGSCGGCLEPSDE